MRKHNGKVPHLQQEEKEASEYLKINLRNLPALNKENFTKGHKIQLE